MIAFTPAERRGALVLVGLLLLGAAHDLWKAAHSHPPASAGLQDAVPGDTLLAGAGAAEPQPALDAGGARPASSRPLDLNRADARSLDLLPGVGPVLAERIVQQRRRFGPYRDLDELRAVRGIGPRLLERLRPLLTVGPAGRTGGRDRGTEDSLDVHVAR